MCSRAMSFRDKRHLSKSIWNVVLEPLKTHISTITLSITKSSTAEGHSRGLLDNNSTCPHLRLYIKESDKQLQDSLNVDLNLSIHTCVAKPTSRVSCR